MIIPIYKMKQIDDKAIDPWQKRLAKRMHYCPWCDPITRMAIHFGSNPYDTYGICPKCEGVAYIWDDGRHGERIYFKQAGSYLPEEVKALINGEITGLELAMKRLHEKEKRSCNHLAKG